MTDKQRKLRNSRYIAGMCIDCGTQKHSAGRPRCNPCHDRNNPHLDAEADRNEYPCRNCNNPTRPGNVLCLSCFTAIKAQARR